MSNRRTRTEWVVMGPEDNTGTCIACGAKLVLELPMPAGQAVAMMQQFVADHVACGIKLLNEPPPEFPGYRLCRECKGAHFTRNHAYFAALAEGGTPSTPGGDGGANRDGAALSAQRMPTAEGDPAPAAYDRTNVLDNPTVARYGRFCFWNYSATPDGPLHDPARLSRLHFVPDMWDRGLCKRGGGLAIVEAKGGQRDPVRLCRVCLFTLPHFIARTTPAPAMAPRGPRQP